MTVIKQPSLIFHTLDDLLALRQAYQILERNARQKGAFLSIQQRKIKNDIDACVRAVQGYDITRQQKATAMKELTIGTKEAAEELGINQRRVQRNYQNYSGFKDEHGHIRIPKKAIEELKND